MQIQVVELSELFQARQVRQQDGMLVQLEQADVPAAPAPHD